MLLLDEVINMLTAVRDAAAADTYSALLPSNSNTVDIAEVATPQRRPTTRNNDHQQQQQQRQQRRRAIMRPASVASVDLRDHDEI